MHSEEKSMESAAATAADRKTFNKIAFISIDRTHVHIYRSYSIITSYVLNATLLHRVTGIALSVYEILMFLFSTLGFCISHLVVPSIDFESILFLKLEIQQAVLFG